MAEGLSWIDYKGKKILYLNYSDFAKDPPNTQKEKTLKLIEAANAAYRTQPERSVLGLGNFDNFHFDMEMLKAFKNHHNDTKKYYKKSAIIGVTGLVKVAYNFVIGLTDKTTKVCDSIESAKEWLVTD